MALFQFDVRGNLFPYEVIKTGDLDQFEEFFVAKFPLSATCALLFAGLIDYLSSLGNLLESLAYEDTWCVWLNGSFTTSELNPNDIDVLNVLTEGPIFGKNKNLFAPLAGHRSRNLYGIDAYFWLTSPSSESEELGRYWRNQFGTDREGSSKGIVELTIVR